MAKGYSLDIDSNRALAELYDDHVKWKCYIFKMYNAINAWEGLIIVNYCFMTLYAWTILKGSDYTLEP